MKNARPLHPNRKAWSDSCDADRPAQVGLRGVDQTFFRLDALRASVANPSSATKGIATMQTIPREFALRAPMSRRVRRTTSARKAHPQIPVAGGVHTLKLRGGDGKAA